MQQTADAVAETKDLTDVDADLVTILVSGLSYSFYAVAVMVLVPAVADAVVAMTVVFGLSSCYSAAAASAAQEADVAATITAATKRNPSQKSFCHNGRSFFIYFSNISFPEAT